MGDVILFRRRPFIFTRVERAKTFDKVIEHPDGAWSQERQRPPGPGWEIERDGERWTVWRRAMP